MSGRSRGQLTTTTLADGTRAFRLRFRVGGERQRVTLHERRECPCGCGGGWTERTAAVELDNILARVRAGVWRKPEAAPPVEPTRVPTFHEYASDWLHQKVEGTLGDRPISENTANDYRWRLARHLLPFFARYPLDEIDADLCQDFRATKIREAADLRAAIADGADLRDRRGQRVRPLSAGSIRKLIDTLASILDEAVEDGHIERNPARGRRMRIRVPKPTRTFLEMDELVALTDAAGALDSPARPNVERPRGTTAAAVLALVDQGRRPAEIAAELGLAKSTVSHHIRRLGVTPAAGYFSRRAVIAILGGAGLRSSELCDVKQGELRLHDPAGARLRIPDSKTEAGIREVQLSPDLVGEIIAHLERLRRADLPIGPTAYLCPNVDGGRMARQRVWRIVREARTLASERLVERGLPPLPTITPHSLRRTYVSIALLANNFDVIWVMSQVGHADSKMTMEVYAQLQQRVRRDHGRAFDALVRRARAHLYG